MIRMLTWRLPHTDDHSGSAIEFLANGFQGSDLVQLRYDAIRTLDPEDDVIVSRMPRRAEA